MQDRSPGRCRVFPDPPAMPYVRSGKLRAACSHYDPPLAAAPTTAMEEAGVPGFDISNWFAYMFPRERRPSDRQLNTEINRALKLQTSGKSSRAPERKRWALPLRSSPNSCAQKAQSSPISSGFPGQRGRIRLLEIRCAANWAKASRPSRSAPAMDDHVRGPRTDHVGELLLQRAAGRVAEAIVHFARVVARSYNSPAPEESPA